MDTQNIQENWTQVRSMLKSRWGKLSDRELDALNGNLDVLPDKLQKKYKISRKKALKELKTFKAQLHPVVTEDLED